MNSRLLAPALALGLAAVAASTAAAQTVINSVPYTISAPGRYVLGGNFITATADVSAITIIAPNVILDLDGFFLSGPGNTPASTRPVINVNNVSNVTIRNGTVANNGYGIFFNPGASSINHLVERVNLTRCYIIGIFVADSAGSTVRSCRISQIGGSTLNPINAYGISSFGGVRLEKNSINDVATSSGVSIGILSDTGSFSIGNTVSNCDRGVQGGKYQNNLTFNCALPFNGGTNAGGNN